jgi:hypothetical protein
MRNGRTAPVVDDRNFPTRRLERLKEINEMGMNVCAANPRDPVLATFDRPHGEWHVVASYLEAKGPPEIVNKIRWRFNDFQCLGAEDAAALGKWMNQALIDDDPSHILRQVLSEQAASYALEDLKLFAEFLENCGGFCIT